MNIPPARCYVCGYSMGRSTRACLQSCLCLQLYYTVSTLYPACYSLPYTMLASLYPIPRLLLSTLYSACYPLPYTLLATLYPIPCLLLSTLYPACHSLPCTLLATSLSGILLHPLAASCPYHTRYHRFIMHHIIRSLQMRCTLHTAA